MTKLGRGVLTPRVNEIAKRMIGREISKVELRLMAYIQYVMVNEQKIEPIHVNQEERKILSEWRTKGFIEGGASGLSITKEFWDFICEIMFESYVAQGEEYAFRKHNESSMEITGEKNGGKV